jgi:aspartate aminotransferase
MVVDDDPGANGDGDARLSYATGTQELKEALEIIDDATRAIRSRR